MRSEFHPGGRRRSHARSTVASRVVLAFLALMLVPGTPSATAADATGVATGVESSTTSRQPLSRQAELQDGEHLANIAPRRRLTQQNEASGPVGRYVKLIVNNFLHFNEMIVYPPGDVHSNAAAGKTVTASDGVDYGGSLAGLVDGDLSTYFHSSDSSDNWVMVDLGEEIAIGGIFLYQTENLGGFYRAVGLYAEILDASQNTVLTTAAVQEERAGLLLDFFPDFVTPVDTNQWRGFDRVYGVDDALDEWKQHVHRFRNEFEERDKLIAHDVVSHMTMGDFQCIAVDGDTMVAGGHGLYGPAGAAYIFTRDSPWDLASPWTQLGCPSNCALGKLTPSDSAGYDGFGTHVVIDGDTIIVSAVSQNDLSSGWTRSNAVYVFTRDNPGNLGSGWSQVAKLSPEIYPSNFAWGLSISGDTLAISDPKQTYNGGLGVVHIYKRDDPHDLSSGWSRVTRLTASYAGDGTTDIGIGTTLSLHGDTLVAGAYLWGVGVRGQAIVFTRDNAGDLSSTWTQRARLEGHDIGAGDLFGRFVSLKDDTLVVGAYPHDQYGVANTGAAYVFTRDTAGDLTSGWTQVGCPDNCEIGEITPWDVTWEKGLNGNGYKGLNFGYTVAIDGDIIVIGDGGGSYATRYQEMGEDLSGTVYIFRRVSPGDLSSRWALVSSVKASDQFESSNTPRAQMLGTSVSVSGYTVIAGASGDDPPGAENGGAVYVFSPRGCDTSQPPTSGTVGSCNATLAIGSTCQPTCDTGYTVSGPSSCSFGTLTAATCEPSPCDASTAPSNGGVGDCTSSLASGSTCQPTCDTGYTVSGPSSCSLGVLTAATCEPDPCTASSDSAKDGSDGTFWCINGGTVGGTTTACTCTDCNPGYEDASCQTASACTASLDPAKDGSDGTFWCINGGSAGGTTGTCTCTSCATRYGGKNCHIGPCDMEKSCFDFNVRNGMTTPASCAFLGDEDVTGCRN